MYKLTATLLACIVCINSAKASSVFFEDGTGSASITGGTHARSLLQTGSAKNSNITVTTPGTSSATALDPTGSDCYISSSSSASIDCKKQGTGTLTQQVPACCTSTKTDDSTKCNTFDSAGPINCINSNRPYPGCCTLRNQPASVCIVASRTTSTVECTTDRPAPACCASRTDPSCNVDEDLIFGALTSCSSTQYNACCPA